MTLNDFKMLLMGIMVGVICWLPISKSMQVNISDTEMLRFCMQHKIGLDQCKIGWDNLDRNTKDAKP